MNDHTKHLGFLFTVPLEFYNEWADVKTQHEIYVRYTLNWKGELEISGYLLKPGMAKFIKNWEDLEKEILKAAKNNAKDFPVRTEYNILIGSRYEED